VRETKYTPVQQRHGNAISTSTNVIAQP